MRRAETLGRCKLKDQRDVRDLKGLVDAVDIVDVVDDGENGDGAYFRDGRGTCGR